MTKKENKIFEVMGKANEGAQKILGKVKDGTTKLMDQNDDGAFNKEDVSLMAETLGKNAKNAATTMMTMVEEKARELERKLLDPIFIEDLTETEFRFSKLVRITQMDKKRKESEVCQGSIGYWSKYDDFEVINIFKDKVDLFGLTFYPDDEQEVYYMDPIDRNKYIALEDYFYYLKEARIFELKKIAQDLGAKHFKVIYKEHKVTFSSQKRKGKIGINAFNKKMNIDAEQELNSQTIGAVEVAAEADFPGHEPMMPIVKYLAGEPAIQSLITQRMDASSPTKHEKITIKLINSSGIKEKDAVKIDGALNAMKIGGNTTITNEFQDESRRFFEYEVDF